jgi:hypothetical protein
MMRDLRTAQFRPTAPRTSVAQHWAWLKRPSGQTSEGPGAGAADAVGFAGAAALEVALGTPGQA